MNGLKRVACGIVKFVITCSIPLAMVWIVLVYSKEQLLEEIGDLYPGMDG
jgi:hypothetical protein